MTVEVLSWTVQSVNSAVLCVPVTFKFQRAKKTTSGRKENVLYSTQSNMGGVDQADQM